MKHDLASEKLLELAYGELTPREERDVEAHAEGCEPCREELARIRETRSLMAQLPPEPPPERGEGIVMAAAREAAEARQRRRGSILPPWLWAGSIGAVAVAAVAVVSWQLAKTAPTEGLRARDGELMGGSRPAEVAVAPAPAAAVDAEKSSNEGSAAPEKKKAAKELAKGDAAERDAMTGAATVAKREEGAATGLGFIGAKDDQRGSGAGAGGSLLSPNSMVERPGDGAVAAGSPPPAPQGAWAPPPPAAAPPARPMADEAERPAAAPAEPAVAAKARPAMRAGEADAARAAKAEADSEAQRLSRARSSERKAAATAASARRPRQAPGSVEVQTFANCPGERRRVVEYGYDGSLLRYLREGTPRAIEHRYSPDGQLVAATAIEGGVRRPLPLDTPGLVRDASEAEIDAPPRCRQ